MASFARITLGITLLSVVWTVFLVESSASSKPNIVYIVTDDQDIKLGSLDVQSNVQSMLIEKGKTFKNAFVSTPVCCPSRSSILTGKYVHNHRTYENTVASGCNAPSWRQLNEQHTVGAYLTTAGYHTGFFGKYLNHYGESGTGVGLDHIPPGWKFWFALMGNSKYLNYNVSWNGQGFHMDDDYSQDYFTDWISQQATFFIDDNTAAYKQKGIPMFLYVAPPAPHRPATPAPQYAELFIDSKAPRTPSYGVHSTDKHWIISDGTPSLTEEVTETIDDLYRNRLRTLQSVDDLVAAVVASLEKNDLLNNTYIIYNSDHGYHLGQFNQQGEKRQPYDEDIRVPLIVTGPGIAPNTSTTALALNIDIAPTILDLAGAPIPDDMDGLSLKEALMKTESETDQTEYQFLVEYYGEGGADGFVDSGFLHDCSNNTFLALRSGGADNRDFLYARFFKNDSFPINPSQQYFTEYYNLTEDPWQVKNIAATLSPSQKTNMETVIDNLYKCSGLTCRQLRTPSQHTVKRH